jgi:hypothetical protein
MTPAIAARRTARLFAGRDAAVLDDHGVSDSTHRIRLSQPRLRSNNALVESDDVNSGAESVRGLSNSPRRTQPPGKRFASRVDPTH